MYAQALSLMARVYIGSVSFEVREDNIKKAFEVFGPIKSINMSYDATTGVSFLVKLIIDFAVEGLP